MTDTSSLGYFNGLNGRINTAKSLSDIWTTLNALKEAIERHNVDRYLSYNLNGVDLTCLPALDHFHLIRFTGIKFRRREDLQKGLEAFYRILHAAHAPIIYILSANDTQIVLCFGLYANDKEEFQELVPIFRTLQHTIQGFFPGCTFEPIHSKEKVNFIKDVFELPERQIITGVPSPSQNKESKGTASSESISGIERLLDAMAGQEFATIVVATPLTDEELADFQGCIAKIHDQVHLLKKATLQHSSSQQTSISASNTVSDGVQQSTTTGTQTSSTKARQNRHIFRRGVKNIKTWAAGGDKAQTQEMSGTSEQHQVGSSHQRTNGMTESESTTISGAITVERTNKTADYLSRQFDEMHQRAQNGRGVGMWRVGTTLLSREPATCEKAASIYAGMVSGEKSHIDPVRAHFVDNSANPLSIANDSYEQTHPLGEAYAGLYTYLTSSELAVAAGIPFYEVASLPVEEMTDYGRSQGKQNNNVKKQGIVLGNLVDRSVETSKSVLVSTKQLNRHCFVTGATGSGKSNTMRRLLLQAWHDLQLPFLVIEPVKSEYRQLQNQIPDLQVFTLGHNTGSSLALNPFDFEHEVGLVSHIDHLKAAFNASLGMYSSMPFILEDIIYRVYEAFGWDLGSGKNEFLERSADRLGISVCGPIRDLFLPRLSDLIPLVQDAIQGFFPSMTDYGGSLLGALRARLTSLTKGTKGKLLDTRSSVPMEWLLSQPSVLEIWPFADNEEKAFVMALILIKLYEYRERKHLTGHHPEDLEHLLVIEEAHRLLAKPQGQGELGSNSRVKGVEVFADILSEIRSYGQGIIIVDQIPSKLIPDVLKNTDVKIAHRLVAKDDRELIGATMTLEKLQIRDLARHEPGLATIYFEGLHTPLKVKFAECRLDETDLSPKEVDLRFLRRVQCFGHIEPEKIAAFPVINQQFESYQLVHGMLTVALSLGAKCVHILSDNLRQRFSITPLGCEWTFAVEGLHTLHQALLHYELSPGERLLSPAHAGYFTSLSASFLQKLIMNEHFTDELALLRAESLGLGLVTGSSEECIPIDFLSVLVGLYVKGTSGNFHQGVTRALQKDSKSEELDWTNIQEELIMHSDAMLLSSPYGGGVFCELASRLLAQYRTNSQELTSLAGLALGTLIKAAGIKN